MDATAAACDNGCVAHLDVIAGPDRGHRLDLPAGEPQMVGRSSEALPCHDPCISRRHAELTPGREGWIIRDLASRHGTWLNGIRVHDAVRLREGDRIRCGESEFVYRAGGGAADADAGPDRDGHGIAERLAAVSHAIKNVLQGLRGGADAVEMALSRGDIAMARQGWPILSRNLDRIASLTLNMLAWSRERPLDREPTDLNSLIREVAQMAGSDTRRSGATVELALDESLPPAHIDITAIHQALMNLVINALDAVPPKSGRIRISSGTGEGGDMAVIAVEDNGPGIPPEVRPRLFQPFVSSKGQRGTGLGLAVTRMLALAHGGSLTHADRAGGGTRMEMRLPLHAPADDPGDTKAPVPMPDSGIAF